MSQLNINSIANQLGTGGPDFVGMPTVGGDPVVESGSNSDGEWVRWADGTQQVRTVFLALDATSSSGSLFRSSDSGDATPFLFPSPFIDTNYSTIATISGNTTHWGTARPDTPTQARVTAWSPISNSGRPVYVTAHGRWK